MQTHDNTRAVYHFISPRIGLRTQIVLSVQKNARSIAGTQVELLYRGYQLTIAQREVDKWQTTE